MQVNLFRKGTSDSEKAEVLEAVVAVTSPHVSMYL